MAIYVAVGWGFYEIASEFLDQFGFPIYTPRLLLILLFLGFPAAVFLAWYFDLDRKGIRAETRMGVSQWLVVVGSLLFPVVGTFIAFPYINKEAESAIAERSITPLDQLAPNSIAVLPFENQSSDPDKEFLAHGLSIEVWNRLVKVPVLQLAHRQNSLAGDLHGLKLEPLAQVLNSRYLLGGDLRLEGDRLRVTATLTDAAKGEVVWTRPYERMLVDIFAVQDDVATAITDAIAGPGVGESFIKHGYRPATSMEAYLDYLRFVASSGVSENEIEALKAMTHQNSDFTEAYTVLAASCFEAAHILQEPPEGPNKQCMWNAARRAVELNENQENGFRTAYPHLALALAYTLDWDWLHAQEELDKAILLAPADQEIPFTQAFMLSNVGRFQDVINLLEGMDAQANPLVYQFLDWAYLEAGELEKCLDTVEHDLAHFPGRPGALMAKSVCLREMGRLDEAQRLEEAGLVREIGVPMEVVDKVYDYWRNQATRGELVSIIDKAVSEGNLAEPIALDFFASIPLEDEFFALAPRYVDNRQLLVRILWRHETRKLRNDPRFDDLVAEFNILPYWRKYGFADVCRPVGDGFTCRPGVSTSL